MCREAFCSQWLYQWLYETDGRLTGLFLSLFALEDDRLASWAFRYTLTFRARKSIRHWNHFLSTNLCNLFTFSLFNIHSSKIRYFDEYRSVYIYSSIFFLTDYENDKLYMLLHKYITIRYHACKWWQNYKQSD